MNRQLFIFLLITLSINFAFGQKLANNWYFGENAGLSFESGSAVALLNGELNTREGCASISSEEGDLLFYTEGTKVWNRNHEQMPNGFDLKGNIGSTQSAIIISKPTSNNLYYIFTIDAVEHNSGENGINYSLVDMNLEGGKGDIVAEEKNINLAPNFCEKVTSVAHSNGEDIWVITQKWNANHFYVYLISNQGVSPTPVISIEGQVINTLYAAIGYMKVSPEGGTLVKANTGFYSVEIFDFDNTTGIVSNPRIIGDYTTRPYGIEFSPNGQLLYVNAENDSDESLFQYDINAGSIDDIIASEVVVASGQTSGALQLGADKRIYVVRDGALALSRINKPNKNGFLCDFEFEAVDLGGREAGLGLPTFVQSYFAAISADFYFENTCLGETTEFYDNSSQEPDSVLWNFDDPASGVDNISILNNPTHFFGSAGNYNVSLTVWKDEIESPVIYIVDVTENPIAFAGVDQIILMDKSTILEGVASGGVPPYNYLWEPDDKLVQNYIPNPETITLTESQLFILNVSDSKNCASEPSEVLINISTGETLEAFPSLSSDTICRGETVIISANAMGGSGIYEYIWTSNPLGFSSTEASFTVVPEETTTYILNLKDSFNTTLKDSVQLTVKLSPILNIMPDGYVITPPNTIVVCVRDTVVLDAGSDLNPEEITYNWNNSGATNQRFLLAISNGSWIETQIHSVEVILNETNCSASDSITIFFDFNECEIGIAELKQETFVIIQPNPNNGKFRIFLETRLLKPLLEIIDINGRTLLRQQFNEDYYQGDALYLNLESLKKGMYFVLIKSEQKQFKSKLLIR